MEFQTNEENKYIRKAINSEMCVRINTAKKSQKKKFSGHENELRFIAGTFQRNRCRWRNGHNNISEMQMNIKVRLVPTTV